jgi:hypothetical protein
MNGKGSKSRITNIKAFRENFDQIHWKTNKPFIGGKKITLEESIKRLNDPATLEEQTIEIHKEFAQKH